MSFETDSEKAMAVLDERKSEIRALVTDVNLRATKLKGWDIARRARELRPDLPVVYVTADCRDEWASHGVPGSILVNKPFVPSQVTTALAQLLNTGTMKFAPALG